MSMHIAFVSSPELRRHSEQLIARVEAGSPEAQSGLMTTTINRFIDEILQVFFLDLVDLLRLKSLPTRLIHGAVATIEATLHGVARGLLHRLDNDDLQPLAGYMGGIMLTAPDASGDPTPYVGFPLEEPLRQRLEALQQAFQGDDPRAREPELAAVLEAITDRALEAYLDTPLALVRLGFLQRRSAQAGITVVRSAIHLLVRRLLPELDGPQLQAVAHHLGGLLLADGQPYRPH